MNRKAFTLLELIMAISFASVIIVGLIQAMRSSTTFLATGRKYMLIDRKVALLFNQLEKDLSCAFIPRLHKDLNNNKDKEDKKETKEKKEPIIHFTATAQEDAEKVQGKKRYGFVDAAWVTTSVLSFGRKEPRLARVGYSFKKEILTRRETGKLDNVKFEEPEDSKKKVVREIVVCDGVKSLYIEFVVPRKQKNSDKELEPLRTYVWGDKDETKNVVPQHAHVYLELWDDEHKRAFAYETMIAIAAFTKPKEMPKPEEGEEQPQEKKEKKVPEPKNPEPPKKSNDISSLFNGLRGEGT